MTYNPNEPKQSDSACLKEFIEPNILRFYGTDLDGNRTTYLNSISNAMRERIFNPVREGVAHPRADFFKPFPAKSAGMVEFLGQPIGAAIGVGLAAGFITAATLGNPYLLIAYVCLPAVSELITAITSLCQGIYQTAKGNHSTAAEYYLDASTRFAMIVPLVALSTVSLPCEIVYFFTRGIASLVQWAGGREPSVSKVAASPGMQDFDFAEICVGVDEGSSNRSVLV